MEKHWGVSFFSTLYIFIPSSAGHSLAFSGFAAIKREDNKNREQRAAGKAERGDESI